MKKNGFTLIELLAIISILSIILLIAVPAINNVIETANKNSFKNTALGILKTANHIYEINLINDEILENIVINFYNNDNVDLLNMKGKLPDNGILIIDTNGDITMAINNDKYCAIIVKDQVKVVSYNQSNYIFDSSTQTITDYSSENAKETDICIPNKINGVEVKIIGNEAFAYSNLTSVAIPNTVTSIGNYAFSDNTISNVVIPDSVTSIGHYAFAHNKLTSVIIPNSIETIIEESFRNNELSSVTIPSSVTKISEGAFKNNKLTNIIIPSSVTRINEEAFLNNNFTNIEIQYNEVNSKTRFNTNWTDIGFPPNLMQQ